MKKEMKRQTARPAGPAEDGIHHLAVRVSVVSIIVNLALTLAKLVAGLIGGSSAMVSDAVHSASDVLASLIVIAGVRFAGKKADLDHPYGHERMECIAAILLSIILAAVGGGIGLSGIRKITAGNYGALTVPGLLPLIAAVVSIVIKEWMFWYTRAAAKKINSSALMAEAWHHRSDALSSIGSFAGILFARLGYPVMDAVAGVVISLCILKAAYDIFKDGIDKMVDHSCDTQTEEQIRRAVLAVEGVFGIDELRTRLFGDKMYVDLEIAVDGNLHLTQAHEIAEQVHDSVEAAFPLCKHCMIHVNPAQECPGKFPENPAAH